MKNSPAQRIKGFIRFMRTHLWVSLLTVVLVLTIPFAIFATTTNTLFFSRASDPVVGVVLTPSTTAVFDQSFTVNTKINANSQKLPFIHLVVKFNPQLLQLNQVSQLSSGFQLLIPVNYTQANSSGKIDIIAGLSKSSLATAPTGTYNFADLRFTPKAPQTTSQIAQFNVDWGLSKAVNISQTMLSMQGSTATIALNSQEQMAQANNLVEVVYSPSTSNWKLSSAASTGQNQYVDRSYTFSQIPQSLNQAAWIQTANNAKQLQSSQLAKLTAKSPVKVWVSVDQRISPPNWISSSLGWSAENLNVVNSEPQTFRLYSKALAQGESLNLGDQGLANVSFYNVFITSNSPTGGTPPQQEVPNDPPPAQEEPNNQTPPPTNNVPQPPAGDPKDITTYCPLPVQDASIIVRIGREIRSDRTQELAQQTVNTNIPAGTYRVTLVSADTHSQGSHATQPNEQYRVLFKNNNNIIAQSGIISDLPNDKDVLVEVVNENLKINQNINRVTAIHPSYRASNPNSLYPVCIELLDLDKLNNQPPTDVTTDELLENLVVHDSSRADKWVVKELLAKNDSQYTDRTYRMTQIPQFLQGGVWISPPNDSKKSSNDTLVEFKLKQNATVYLAVDTRVENRLSWLTGWEKTSNTIVNSEVLPKTFRIYKKPFTSGSTVQLGAQPIGGSSMYIPIILSGFDHTN